MNYFKSVKDKIINSLKILACFSAKKTFVCVLWIHDGYLILILKLSGVQIPYMIPDWKDILILYWIWLEILHFPVFESR